MKLPHANQAVVELDKLTQYCLNPAHPRGRHKARVFESVLGLTTADAELVRQTLLDAALRNEAVPAEGDEHGQRYVIEFATIGPAGSATIRSAGIVRADEDFPRFVSCYVL